VASRNRGEKGFIPVQAKYVWCAGMAESEKKKKYYYYGKKEKKAKEVKKKAKK